jgi:hypothetical protein
VGRLCIILAAATIVLSVALQSASRHAVASDTSASSIGKQVCKTVTKKVNGKKKKVKVCKTIKATATPTPTPTATATVAPTPPPIVAGTDPAPILQALQYTDPGDNPADYSIRIFNGRDVLYNDKVDRIDGTEVNGTWYRGLYDDVKIPELPELGGVVYDAVCEDTGQRQTPVNQAAINTLRMAVIQIDMAQNNRTWDKEVAYIKANNYQLAVYLPLIEITDESGAVDHALQRRYPSLAKATSGAEVIDLRQPAIFTVRGPSQTPFGEGLNYNALPFNAFLLMGANDVFAAVIVDGGTHAVHYYQFSVIGGPSSPIVRSDRGYYVATMLWMTYEVASEQHGGAREASTTPPGLSELELALKKYQSYAWNGMDVQTNVPISGFAAKGASPSSPLSENDFLLGPQS